MMGRTEYYANRSGESLFVAGSLRIGGSSQNVGAANPATSALPSAGTQSGNDCKSPFAAPSGGQSVTGTISYGDYEVANTGNTMHQGIITLSYEYTRA